MYAYVNELSQRGQLVFTDTLKTKALQGYEKGLLRKDCMEKNDNEILLFSGNKKIKNFRQT